MLLIIYIECMVNTMNNNDSGDLFPKYNFLARTEPAVIRNLTVSEITTSSVFLSWIEPLGNRSFYRVEWTGGSRDMNTTTNETAFNVTELTAGVKYTFKVTAVAGDNITKGNSQEKALFTSNSFYRVEWTGGSRDMNTTSNETAFNVTELTAGVKYTFRVTAVAGDEMTEGKNISFSLFTREMKFKLSGLYFLTASCNILWIEPLGNRSFYRVEWTGGSRDMNTTTNETAFNVTELTAGVKYTFKVTAVAGDNITKGNSQEKALFTGKPFHWNGLNIFSEVEPYNDYVNIFIRNLTVFEITTSSVFLSWIEPLGNSSFYRVEWTGGSRDMNTTSNETAFNVTELTAGVKYTFRVTAVAGDEMTEGKNISVSLFTSKMKFKLSGLYFLTASCNILWIEPLGNRSFYRVEWTGGSRDMNTTTNETAFNVTELTAGVKYTFKVTAVAGDNITKGNSQEKALFTKPEVIRNLTVSEITTSSVFLSWIEPLGNSSFYRVDWTGGSRDMNTTSNETAFNVTELTAGVKYTFRVTAVAGDEMTEGKNISVSLFTKPAVIRNLTVSEITTSSVFLSWIEPLGNRSFYRVEWTDGNISGSQNTTETSVNVTALTAGVQYNFTVTAVAGDNTTVGQSKTVSKYTKPAVVRNLSVSEITTSSVSLNWTQPEGNISFYRVNWTGSNISRNTTETFITIIRLTAGMQYNFTVTAVAGDSTTEGEGSQTTTLTSMLFSNLIIRYRVIKGIMKVFGVYHKASSYLFFSSFFSVAVIGVAVGVTIGVFAILFIITVGLIIYWRSRLDPLNDAALLLGVTHVFVLMLVSCVSMSRSVPVRVEDYEAYYKRQKADSNCGFAEEFEDLKPVGKAQAKISAEATENKPKNRYNNVLPYDSSRVKLSIHGSPFDDYINSNYIPGYNSRKEFIAAQGPLPITVNEFWRMIWEKNVQTLVMLTRCNEQGRVKCEKYWPSETKHFQNITVTTTSEIPLEDWTIRDFDVKNVRTAETRSVRHFHFTAWPDHGVPETTELLINFRHLVREHMDQYSRHSPTVVHCSAGVGRTGTFIAIDRLIFQIERDSMVDVYGTIHDLRMHRPLMVQTEDQYLFLNQCAIDIIRSRTGTNVDLIYQNTAALSIYENVEPRKDTAKNGYHNT
uniref:protein-tyrosine-phosphatase n=1 Tax=Salmo trutta TaxID=8032 RepID=A0A673ZZ67_SALTR